MAKDVAVKKQATDIAPIETKAGTRMIHPVVPDVVEVYDDFIEDETGLENVTKDDRRIPLLRILDPKSPQCKPVERGGIPGARGGAIFNTATGQVFDGTLGLYFVPCCTEERYVCYIKRNDDGSGGGFVAVYEPNDPLVKQRIAERQRDFGNLFGKLRNGVNEDGKELELVQTKYLFGIFIVPNADGSYPGEYGEFFSGMIPFQSTTLKTHAAFVERCENMLYPVMTKTGIIVKKKAQMWGHVWHIRSSYFERGTQSWYVWQMTLAAKNEDGSEKPFPDSRLPKEHPLAVAARDLRVLIMENAAGIDYGAVDTSNAATEEGAAYGGPVDPNDIPLEH